MTSAYFDASVLLPLFIDDDLSTRARQLFVEHADAVVLSDWTVAEMVSATARRVRTGVLIAADARLACATWDRWIEAHARRIEVDPSDVRTAEAVLRGFETPLRTPDALHVGIARRLGLPLATFDSKMAESARLFGLDVIDA